MLTFCLMNRIFQAHDDITAVESLSQHSAAECAVPAGLKWHRTQRTDRAGIMLFLKVPLAFPSCTYLHEFAYSPQFVYIYIKKKKTIPTCTHRDHLQGLDGPSRGSTGDRLKTPALFGLVRLTCMDSFCIAAALTLVPAAKKIFYVYIHICTCVYYMYMYTLYKYILMHSF